MHRPLAQHRTRSSARLALQRCQGRQRRTVQVTNLTQVFQVGQSWVAADKSSRRRAAKGVVHFLGGAFAGAAPQVLYSLFIDKLASAGYTVVAVPFAVTFQHLECTDRVAAQFEATLQEVRMRPDGNLLAPQGCPLLGVGHSNGALLHLLMGARHPGATTGTVAISFNNKQVSEAIPVPGLLGNLSPAIAAVRTGSFPLPLFDAAALLQGVAKALPPGLSWLDEAGQLSKAALGLEQLGLVFGEVGDGVTEFSPVPGESRRIIREGYDAARQPLLLVRFAEDGIDETPEIATLLTAANPPGSVTSVTLPGSHVTPCGGDLRWQTDSTYFTPLDAVVMLSKVQGQADIRRLAATVVQFLDSCVATSGQRPTPTRTWARTTSSN